MSTHRRLALAALVLLPLAACDSFGLAGPQSPPAPAARAIDYRADDLAGMIFAINLPAGVQVLPKSSTARFDAGAGGAAGRHVKATFTLADGGDIDGQLPPPAAGRTYYLLGFGARDKTALRAAQAWLGEQNPPPVVSFTVTPGLCMTSPPGPGATGSVIPVSPGKSPFLPLVTIPVASVPPCR